MNKDYPKKRNKPTLVCIRCKRRKIKCNRELPCSSCINTNVGNECTYESKWQPITSIKSSNKKTKPNLGIGRNDIEFRDNYKQNEGSSTLKFKETSTSFINSKSQGGVQRTSLNTEYNGPDYVLPAFNPYVSNPIGPLDDEVNFHEGYTPIHVKDESRRLCFNPLCCASLLKKDPCLYQIWLYVGTHPTPLGLLMKGISNLSEENINELSIKLGKGKSEGEFVSKLFHIEGYEELLPYKKLLKIRTNNVQSNNKKMELSTKTLANTLFDKRLDPELELIEKIKVIMPKKKVVWKLIDKYFETLYPYMPFVDKYYFQEDMEKILGKKSYENEPFKQIKIIKRLDLAHIAICLILLRFTYLSHFSNRKCINEEIIHSVDPSTTVQDLKYLILNPINVEIIEIAQLCLDRFEISRKTNLTVFQATLYMRLYHSTAPEDGDGTDGGDSQVSTAVLIQMAYALGLNREPDNFKDVCNDERINNLGRRMWHFLVRSDIIHCLHVGNPMSIDPRHYDVKYPFFTESNKTSDDTEIEKAIAETFGWFHGRLMTVRRIVDMFLDIRGYHEMNNLTQTLNEVEKVCREDFCTLENMTCYDTSSKRLLDVVNSRIFIALKGSSLTIYHHIYLHYENKLRYDIMFFYFKKCFLIIQKDLLPYFFAVFYGKLSNSGLVLNPYVEMAVHKANQLNISFLIRVTSKVYRMQKEKDHMRRMNEDVDYQTRYLKFSNLSRNIKTVGNLLLSLMSKISDRYFYAWRVIKSQRYLISVVCDPNFYEKIPEDAKGIDTLNLTLLQLDEMDNLTHSLGKELESIACYQDVADIDSETASYSNRRKSRNNTIVGDTIGNDNNNYANNTSLGGVFEMSSQLMTDDSPLLEFTYPNNDDIDQMWLLVMALKYDALELISGDFDPIGYFNQPLQSTIGDRFDTDPKSIVFEGNQ